MQKIVFHKLLGFGTLTSDEVDFSDVTFAAKLGAKVGAEESGQAETKGIEFSKLLGFQTVAASVTAGVDLKDDTLRREARCKGRRRRIPSDARLKRDIDQVATRNDGLQIYSFRYLWDDEFYVGVMAQDLLGNAAWRQAVVTRDDGKLAVNYAKIGLRMATLEEWHSKGMEALRLPS